MRKKIVVKQLTAIMLAVVCVLSCGCTAERNKSVSLIDCVKTVIAEDGKAPAGSFYSSYATEGGEEYADIRLLNALFGDGEAISGENRLCEEFAMYMSKRNVPYEVAVFKLYSGSNCDYFAILCQRRIDALKREYSDDRDRLERLNSARVTISGRCVIMVSAVGDPKEMTRSLVNRG